MLVTNTRVAESKLDVLIKIYQGAQKAYREPDNKKTTFDVVRSECKKYGIVFGDTRLWLFHRLILRNPVCYQDRIRETFSHGRY